MRSGAQFLYTTVLDGNVAAEGLFQGEGYSPFSPFDYVGWNISNRISELHRSINCSMRVHEAVDPEECISATCRRIEKEFLMYPSGVVDEVVNIEGINLKNVPISSLRVV